MAEARAFPETLQPPCPGMILEMEKYRDRPQRWIVYPQSRARGAH
jgi:hypothetical protein